MINKALNKLNESIKQLINEKAIKEAINYIRSKTKFKPQIALILGSGLGDFGNHINIKQIINSSEVPHYPISSVQGHAGKLIFGYLNQDNKKEKPLLIFQGRVHYYESGLIDKVTFPLLLAKQLGVTKLIVTNAAGGINENFVPGDLMLIKDILSLTFVPLPYKEIKVAVNKLKYFDLQMQKTIIKSALNLRIPIKEGVYAWLKGPSYETPAEINMLKRIGVDAVGMSTVPEIFLAKELQIKTVALSLISNLAAGISPSKLTHKEVTDTANKVKIQFSKLIEHTILDMN